MSRRPEGAGGLPERLGANIKAARISRGMTQGQLAGEDITRNMLSLIENGSALPSIPTLCAIAERLELTPGALMGDLGDFFAEKMAKELRALLSRHKYGELIERWDAHSSKYPEAELTPELCDILIEGLIGRAIELFQLGRLKTAIELLNRADALEDPRGYDVSAAREKALTCRMMISGTMEGKCSAESISRLSNMIFSENGQAFYALARDLLTEPARIVRSEPGEEAAELRRTLTPFLERLGVGLIRNHVEAKLAMIEADYLSAKAMLLPLCSDKLPPSVMFDLYSDLEHCCKCCGDFENAYKFSTEKLRILQKLKL